MKLKIWAVLLTAVFLFTGCSYNQTGIDSLLKPPKLSDEQNKMYNALEAALGSSAKGGIKLKYPRNGDFISAFVKSNLDDESSQEAIVFYEVANSATATMPLHINVLDQQNGEWVSTADITTVAGASEVEKISFITIQQKVYIVAGFNLTSTTDKVVVLYSYEEGMLREKFRISCNNYEVVDLDDNKESEIVAMTSKKSEGENKTATAELWRITDTGNAFPLSTAVLDPNVTEYTKIIKGKLRDGRTALYLDGFRGTNLYTTEILTCQGQQILNLMYQGADQENLISSTARNYGASSTDLDGDGVVEIPVRIVAPGYESSEKHQQEYFTQWYVYENKGLTLSRTTYVAGTLGYIFTLPETWLGKVTVQYLSNESELTFYEYKEGGGWGEKLLSVKVVKYANMQKEATEKGYAMLKDYGQIMYVYKIERAGMRMGITAGLVERSFKIYKM